MYKNLRNVDKTMDEVNERKNASTYLLSARKDLFFGYKKIFFLIPIGLVIWFLIVPICFSQQHKDYRRKRRRKARRRLDRFTNY